MGTQHAKKVVPDSPGLVDFVIRLVNSVLNLPNRQVKFFNKRTVKSILLTKTFLGLVEITFWLVNASFSLPEWQVVKVTFSAPWEQLHFQKKDIVEIYSMDNKIVIICTLMLGGLRKDPYLL